MTVYLWHITALIALVGLAMLAGGIGLKAAPGEAAWWLWRPVWIVALLLAMPAFLAVFGRFETSSRRPGSRPPGPLRAVLGAGVTCAGLTFLALHGAGAGNLLGVNLAPALLALFGVGLATVGTSEDR
jgi:hypothetical protein